MDEVKDINDEIAKIKETIAKIHNKYLGAADDIRTDYNKENETRDDYRGRQISELLQNADDCYSEACPIIDVKFELRGNILIIQNNGNPFSYEGIKSLMYSNNSSKHEGTIGYKGLGFRSVLNWSNKISIYTKAFNVNFSEEKAIEKFQEYKKYYKNKGNQDDIKIMDSIDRIAILDSAEVNNDCTEKTKWLEEGYSTAIVLSCTPECVNDIQNQLIDFQLEELLFLKHIRNICIVSPKIQREIKAVDEGESISIFDGEEVTNWTVWKKEGKVSRPNVKDENYELKIAYNNDEEKRKKLREKGVLYSYFKTDIPMPFPFLVHGTFDLTSNRNGLKKENSNNQEVINALIDFIAEKGEEIADEIANNGNQSDYYAPLKFVLPARSLGFLDTNYQFTEKLKQKIKSCKLFPTIGNRYISFDDCPYYSKNRFDKYVSTQTFVSLLKHCDDPIVCSYIDKETFVKTFNIFGFVNEYYSKIGFYSENDMVQLLNKDAEEYVAKKVNDKLIKLFYEEYKNDKIAPKLLVDSNGRRIADDGVTIFNNEDNKFNLPEWSTMCFINSDLEKKLCEEFNCNSKQLMKKLAAYGCEVYSFGSVVKQLEEQSKNDIQRTKDVLKWLYKNLQKKPNLKDELSQMSINVVSRTGKIVSIFKCYLGKEYGNEIGERITSCLSDVEYVASCTDLGFEESERDSAKTFLSQFGVVMFPIVKLVDFYYNNTTDYRRYNYKKYPKIRADDDIEYECTDKKGGLFYQGIGSLIKVADIEGVETILENADYKDILYWILNDSSLRDHIESENEIDNESCMYGRPYKSKELKKVGKDQMRSWLRKKFTEVEWLPTKSGKKVNCSGCTIKAHKFSRLIKVLDIDYKALAELMGKPNREVEKKVKNLLKKLGVAEDIDDLPPEKIYEILLKLPEKDTNYVLGEKFYNELKGHFNKEKTEQLNKYNSAYNTFCKEGKVLAEINGNLEYLPTKEVYYEDKKIYSQDILKYYPIFVLKCRCDYEIIKQLFGVKSISEIGSTIEITPMIHHLNDTFQDEYQKLLPYIYAKRLSVISKDKDDKEFNMLKDSKIILVEDATTKHKVNGKFITGQLHDYELIFVDKIAYIKIPCSVTKFKDLKAKAEFEKTAAEAIITILDIDCDRDSFVSIFERTIKKNEEHFKEYAGELKLAMEKFSRQNDTDEYEEQYGDDDEDILSDQNDGIEDVNYYKTDINEDDTENIDYEALNKKIAGNTTDDTFAPKLTALEQHRSRTNKLGRKTDGEVDYNSTEDRKITGFIAESKVYNTLVAKVGEKSVKWVSGNGARAGKVERGDDSLGYDMRYTDAEGKLHYVEVKGKSSDNLVFTLTKNQFEFGHLHKEQYELWFVFIYDDDVSIPYELGTIFVLDEDEDFFHNHRFTVEQTEFKFKAKITSC